MTTTGEKLASLSGLPSGTVIEHLMAISPAVSFGTGLNTGQRLVQLSKLATGTAMQHLLSVSPVLDESFYFVRLRSMTERWRM
jgi:hypothetical protein